MSTEQSEPLPPTRLKIIRPDLSDKNVLRNLIVRGKEMANLHDRYLSSLERYLVSHKKRIDSIDDRIEEIGEDTIRSVSSLTAGMGMLISWRSWEKRG